MKKILSIVLILTFSIVSLVFPVGVANAQQNSSPNGLWVVDPEVTFIGKNAARSGHVLNWTLINYQWSCVTKVDQRNCDNNHNPLSEFWQRIVFFVVTPMLILVILATSAVIIMTRGKSLTIMRFLPRFIAVLVLITFSYSLLQFLYQFFDLIQGFFLRTEIAKTCPPDCIQDSDLLYVGWKYENFVGLRLLGDYNAESAFMSLLLTKLTALTYFVMVGILLIRKIILWFFIIVSPIFPILLLYYPIRNTGKIWIGEFFRWLLYGPLFAIFLQGLVFMWRFKGSGGGGGIPLQFLNSKISNPQEIIYPTAVNILLGGPQQFVTPDNSVNLPETFMLYVVALAMLWIVILLPWILLQIFLDYAANFSPGDNAVMKNLVSMVSNKMVPPPAPAGYSPQPGGTALSLPFTKKTVNIPVMPMPGGAAKSILTEAMQAGASRPITAPLAQVSAEVMSFANMPLPTMHDIAKYETALLSKNDSQKQEVVRMQQTLEKIANPVAVTSTIEREKYTNMKERLTKESQQGNIVATSVLNAVNSAANNQSRSKVQISTTQLSSMLQQIASPAQATSPVNRERMTNLHEMLSRESSENNSQLASTLLSVTDRTSSNEVEKIRESLMQAQQQNNSVASSVLTQISSTQKSSEGVSGVKAVLSQIANPALTTNTVEREKMSQLHDALLKESKENNNQVATSILSVNDKTSTEELEKIKDQLYQANEGTIASTVLSTINNSASQEQQTLKVKNVLQQVANPATASAVNKEKINKLHETLKAESQKGDQFAASLLAVSQVTSTADIEKLQEKLNLEKAEGKSIAKDVLDIVAKEQASEIPSTNRIQNVTTEELEDVKKLWKDTYSNLEVPQGTAGNRSEWIKDDIGKIDTIISNLNSDDQEKINEGINEVSNILPFLLVGGFSQSDIISYLTVKQEAAKEILKTITTEEETKVTVETRHTQAAQTMAAQFEAPSTEAYTPSFETTNFVAPQVSNEILNMVNLKLPTMRDIVRFETVSYSRDKSKSIEIQKAHELLENIANPSKIQTPLDREKITELRERLLEESQKGNSTADMVLNAASVFTQKIDQLPATLTETKTALRQIANPTLADTDQGFYSTLNENLKKEENNSLATKVLAVSETTTSADIEALKAELLKDKKENKAASDVIGAINRYVELKHMKVMFSQIADPSTIASPVNKDRLSKLHDQLVEASKSGNQLATAILDVKETTKTQDIDKLKSDLADAGQKNDTLAQSILSNMSSTTVPADNRVQTVTQDDYDESKKMWEENYRTLPVPVGFNDNKEGRIDWIEKEREEIQKTIDLLKSTDTEKKNEGLKKVGAILPFLLLGGFSYQEIVAYLNIKLEAANSVLNELKQSEEKEEKVDVAKKTQEEPKTMAVAEEIPKEEDKTN